MKLVVGLGNPGTRYADTRHNVGFRVVERFAERHGLVLDRERFEGRFGSGPALGRPLALLLPHTWMNLCGAAVAQALRGLDGVDPERDLCVVGDDLDLPFGRLRLRAAGGAGGHRGLASIIETLGTRAFARLRFGIGRPPADVDPAEWVLERFDRDEQAALAGRLEAAVDALDAWIADGVEAAMSRTNRRDGAGDGEEETGT